jgi:hypothetical protein
MENTSSTMKSKLTILLIVVSVTAFTCKKKDPPAPVSEPEVVTTMRITFTDSANQARMYFFADPDGDGGNAGFFGPNQTMQSDSLIVLDKKTLYNVELAFFDESKSPAVDLTGEIKEDGHEHMVFFGHEANTVQSAQPYTVKLNQSGVTIRYGDMDQGSPSRAVGLNTKWTTSDSTASSHPLRITLRHQPEKDGTYAPGETDVEVTFRLKVK